MSGQVIKPDLNERYPVLVRGEGIYVYDDTGRRYLDGAAGVGVMALGYGVQRLAAALQEQADAIPYVHGMRFSNPRVQELADKLASFAPPGMSWCFFASGGSEAMDSALKIARQYWLERGQPGKARFIGRWQSFHGNTIGGLSVGGHIGRRKRHLPLLQAYPHLPPAYCYRCPFGWEYPECQVRCASELEHLLRREGAEQFAAFIAEPIVGAAAGAITPPPEYFEIIREICDRYQILFIADEVITGFGRTGKNFGIQHWGVTPDLMVTAKGISAGYAPLAAVIVADQVMTAFQNGSGRVDHNFTFAGNPLACRIGSAALDLLVEGDLVACAQERGNQLFSLLQGLEHFPFVGDIRGRGLLAGIELVADRKTRTPFPTDFAVGRCINQLAYQHGLIVYPGSGTADGTLGDHILLMPPLTITEAEVVELVERLTRTFLDFQAQMA